MTRKLFTMLSGVIGGVEAIGVALITYFVEDSTLATAINASIIIAGTAAIDICSQFVKE